MGLAADAEVSKSHGELHIFHRWKGVHHRCSYQLTEDRFYVHSGTRKKDVDENQMLRTRPTFSKSIMVSVGVSKLGCTAIHFVEPGVKVNGEYYRNNLLGQKLLPDMRRLSQDEDIPGAADILLHTSDTVAAEFARPQPGRLQHLECSAGESLWIQNCWHRWTQNASRQRVGAVQPVDHWCRDQPVSPPSERLCPCMWGTLRG